MKLDNDPIQFVKEANFLGLDLGYKTHCKKLLKKAKIEVGEIALNSILSCCEILF